MYYQLKDYNTVHEAHDVRTQAAQAFRQKLAENGIDLTSRFEEGNILDQLASFVQAGGHSHYTRAFFDEQYKNLEAHDKKIALLRDFKKLSSIGVLGPVAEGASFHQIVSKRYKDIFRICSTDPQLCDILARKVARQLKDSPIIKKIMKDAGFLGASPALINTNLQQVIVSNWGKFSYPNQKLVDELTAGEIGIACASTFILEHAIKNGYMVDAYKNQEFGTFANAEAQLQGKKGDSRAETQVHAKSVGLMGRLFGRKGNEQDRTGNEGR